MQLNYGWTEYEVKEKTWQLLTNDGSIWVKIDMKGNFLNIATGDRKHLTEIYGFIKNCTNSEGVIIAKRKKYGNPLVPMKKKRIKIS
ncbi:hypothetical protein CEQ21_07370 (plasmid) [Niallia circulans]|uniref:Uncharacterized protein n=1 Tax=Niallia circulans TaxID=1397 RepID=A0A553SQV0_NIACI|nr:hypothetical protein [Niallia circulans]TRZ39373.1 hypothetical protein CEQ21_07370 [Niallia circulans]